MAAEGISERAYHSLVAYGDHLYSFAGCNIFHFCFNDLHVYSLSTISTPSLTVTVEVH